MANKCLCGWGSAPDPAGRAYSAPTDPLAGLRGPTSKGRGEERGGDGKEREGMPHLCRGVKGPAAPYRLPKSVDEEGD